MAQPLCTVPTALPRCSARITSPMSTAPAAHSPPKPSPLSARREQLREVLREAADEGEEREPEDRDLQRAHSPDAVGEQAGDPAPDGREQQRDGGEQAGLALGDSPGRDERRNGEAVELHV